MWLEALKLLQSAKDLPQGEEQLFASLRISFDALPDQEKRMFLDAASFFLGRRANTAMHAWKGCASMAEMSQNCINFHFFHLREFCALRPWRAAAARAPFGRPRIRTGAQWGEKGACHFGGWKSHGKGQILLF